MEVLIPFLQNYKRNTGSYIQLLLHVAFYQIASFAENEINSLFHNKWHLFQSIESQQALDPNLFIHVPLIVQALFSSNKAEVKPG